MEFYATLKADGCEISFRSEPSRMIQEIKFIGWFLGGKTLWRGDKLILAGLENHDEHKFTATEITIRESTAPQEKSFECLASSRLDPAFGWLAYTTDRQNLLELTNILGSASEFELDIVARGEIKQIDERRHEVYANSNQLSFELMAIRTKIAKKMDGLQRIDMLHDAKTIREEIVAISAGVDLYLKLILSVLIFVAISFFFHLH